MPDAADINRASIRLPPLSCKVLLSYCSIQFCFNMIYANFPTMRLYVYKDALKLPLGTMGWMMTLAKTLDMLTGFVLGYMSDQTRTKWGRRKPYIMVAWPLGALVMVIFLSGANIFGGSAPVGSCSDLAPLATGNETCAALRACLDAGIENGTLMSPSEYVMPTSSSNGGYAGFFFVLYCLYFTTVVSGTQIAYDALGQELTDNQDQRMKLFSYKIFFSMLGAIVGTRMPTRLQPR